MSRVLRIAKKVNTDLNSVKTQFYNALEETVKCSSFVLVDAYSEAAESFLNIGGKVKCIVRLRNSGETSVDTQNMILTFPVSLEDFNSDDYYAASFKGSVGFFDARSEGKLASIPEVNVAFRRFSYIVYLLTNGIPFIEDLKNVPEGRWRFVPIEVPGFNFVVLENRDASNRDCSIALGSILPSFEGGPPLSPREKKEEDEEREEEKKEKVEEREEEKEEGDTTLVSFQGLLSSLPHPYQKKESVPPLSKEWYLEFRLYISSLLSMFFSEKDIPPPEKEKMLTDENLAIFALAFISPMYDLNPDSNYDILEFLGDKILASAFSNYLNEKFPGSNEKFYSELKSRYMSYEYQHLFGRKMDVKKWVIADPNLKSISTKIEEDVFEAFVGAIQRVSYNIYPSTGPGYGAILVQKLINNFWKRLDINLSLSMGSNITIIEQAEKRFGWERDSGKPIENIITDESGGIEYVISYRIEGGGYTKFMRNIFDKLNKDWTLIPPAIYVEKKSRTKKTALNSAAAEVIRIFEELGVTREALTNEDIRSSAMYSNPEYTSLIDQVIERASAIGIKKIYTEVPKEGNTGTEELILLVGVNSLGRLVKLFSASFPRLNKVGKENEAELMRRYLDS